VAKDTKSHKTTDKHVSYYVSEITVACFLFKKACKIIEAHLW